MGDLRNFYKNAADKGIINKDVKYEDFEKAMRDEKERKSFYKYATSNGLKIGAPERFDEYVSAHLTPSEPTTVAAQPAQQPQTQQSTTNPTNGQEQQQAATQQTQQPANQKDYRDLQFRMQMGDLQNKINNYQPQVDIPKRQTFAERLGEINNYALEQRRADPHAIAERTIADVEKDITRLSDNDRSIWESEHGKKSGFRKMLAEAAHYSNPAAVSTPNPNDYQLDPYLKTASDLLLEAKSRMRDGQKRGYKFGDFSSSVGRNLALAQEGVLSLGVSDLMKSANIARVFEKVNTEDAINNPESVLNEKELALYNAYIARLSAEFARDKDTNVAAKAGKITSDMVQFVEEMALFSGLWGRLNKSVQTKLARLLTEKIVQKASGKVGQRLAKAGTGLLLNTVDTGLRAGETAATSLLLPRTYAKAIDNTITVANNNDGIQFDGYKLRIGDLEQNTTADAFLPAWRDQWKEMFTETGGLFKFGGKILFRNPITRKVFNQVGRTKFGSYLDGINKGLNKAFPKFAKTIAYDGTFQEWTEEVEAAGWDYLFGDKKAFDNFFSKEQQLPMIISFGLPALFGASVNVSQEGYFRKKYDNAIEGLRTTLHAQDYDTESIDEIIAVIKEELYSTNVENLPQKIRDMTGTLLGDDATSARNRFVSRYEELQEKKHLTQTEQDEMVALERFLQNDKTQMMIDCLSQLAGAETALAQINVQTDKERRQAVERARQAEREYGQVPIAQNEWGAVYDWRNRTPQEGADFLMQAQSGYLRGVFHRDGIGDSGDVDMNWGHYKGGLLHMIDKHIIRHADFENVEDLMKTLNNLISNGDVEKRDSDGKWIINDDNYTAVITADDNGNWVLTSFDSTRAKKDKERTPEAQEAKRKELGIATLSDSDETANADEERTLVPQTENQLETSDDKGTATISPTQEEQINSLQKQYEQDKQNYPALFGELSFEQYLESMRDEYIRRNEEAEDHNLFDEEVELYQSALDYLRHQHPSPTQQFANQATQEVTQKYADITHNDGNVYQVSDPTNTDRKGYIVGDNSPVIDASGENPIITNSDVVTVKWNDGTTSQLPAKDLNIESSGTAQDFINAEVEQRIDQHTAERIENGETPTLMQKNGQLHGFFPVEGKDGVVEDKYGNQYTPEQLTQDGWQETQPVYFTNGANQVVTALDNGDGTYSAIDAMGNVMGERFTQVDMNNQGFVMMPIEQTTETPQSSAPAQEETQETETPSAQQPESQEPIEPNVQTMSPQQLAASAVEFMGSREDAVSWLDMQIEQTQKTLKAAQNLKPKSADALGFRNEMAQIRQAQQTAQAQLDKLNEAKKQANRYRTQAELAQEAADNQRREEEARKAAELRELRRKTEEAQAGTTPAEKWNGSPKVQGNTVTRTLPGGTKIKGHYVLAEAGTATPSHDPFNNWNTSEGFPTTEDGRNINDRDYKTDKDAQQITMQIAQTYDGQAVEQVPVISSDGIVYDGNGRTIAGNIAATNNTDAAYLEALAENAGNFGFTPEQLAQFQHPRVYLQLDEDLPYNTTTFARFNSQEKKTQSSTNRAVNNSKKLTDAARDGLLQIIDNYGTLDTFFASEKGASDVINSILDNGIITQQEVAGLTEQTATGYLLSPAGRDYVTDLLIGALFDEQTIKLLGSDKGLKQSILRALPSIVENRRLGDYSLTDNINGAIRLLYEARRAGMTYGEFIRQTNAFDGAVSDRYSAFEMLLAEEMQAGVEQFRQVLNIYNQSSKDEANGQTGLFEPRTPEDIKQEILDYYAKRQPTRATSNNSGQQQPANVSAGEPAEGAAKPQTQPLVQSAQAGDGEQVETKHDEPKNESKNTIFTDEKAERVRARMRARRNHLNMGIDPEQFADGVFMAGYYVEKGMRKFADFARAMIKEFGYWVRPYLKQWYMGLRYDPRAVGQEFLKDMDDINTVDKFDVDNFKVEEPKTEKKPQASLQPWDSTPMGVQYHKIKEQYPDALLLFRVGDFYEMYSADAEEGSKILGITLTKRSGGKDGIPMAGFPFHALDTYLPKLVRAGKRVAICDQLEDPKKAKNKVKTGLTELIAPENNTEKPLQTENNAVPLQGEEPTAENPNRVIRHIGEIRKSKHTQTGEDLWIVNPTDRVSDEEFKQLKARARNNNGYYSSFKANKGFIFKSEEDANNFNNIEDERTTDETAANTTAIAEQGQVVAGEAAAIEPDRGRESEAAGEQRTEGDTPSVGGVGTVEEKTPEEREQTITTAQRAIDKIDEAVEKHDEQLALLGYYAADTNDPSKFHEVYGYRRTAENKAIVDADRLAKQLAEDLGIKLESKRKKLATANIPPAGGEITFRLPLENGNELSLQIDIASNESWRAFYRQDGSEDDLHVTGLVWRIENPSKNGSSRYVTDFSRFAMAANGFNLTYRALLQDIRTRAKNYLPQAEISPNTTRNEIVAKAIEKQKKRKADKNAIQDNQQMIDLFADAVEDLNNANAEESTPEQEVQPINTTNNGDTEVRNDGQRESSTPQRRSAGQPADENGTLGGSQRQTDEGTDTRGVGARGEQYRLHDGERGLGTTGQRTSEPVEEPVAEGERKNTRNFRYDPADPAPTSNKARYEANLAAIRLLKQLQDEGRQATPEEQRVLAKFTGWGGLGEYFKGEPGTTYYSHGEKSPYQTIKELLTDEEMEAAQLSRNSAYYTPAPVIDRLWDIAKQLGFKGGNILEGSAGIGNILAQMPQSISDRSNLQAVEIDPITAGILAQLYPDAQTHAAGFQEVNLPNNSQDLVITNVPFVTGLRVYDKQEKDLSKRFGNIHDFCIAKNVRKLRQGGLGIFITSSGTLDSSKDLRRWLNNEGETDVIGAFRLNRETFGGTSATSDIIVVRKRVNGQKAPNPIDVLDTETARTVYYEEDGKEVGRKLIYNRYFVEHPESMGGEMGFGFEHGDTRWGGTTAGCYPVASINQTQRLQEWVSRLDNTLHIPTYQELEQGALVSSGTYERYEGAVPYGTLILNSKGQICKAYHGEAIPVEGINPTKVKGHTKAEVLKDYNAIKSALDELLAAQTKDISDAELKPYLQKLNNAYNTFTRKYGNLNRNVSLSFLRNDVQWASISALEDVKETVDANGKKKVEVNKTDVFTKRVVGVMPQPKAETTKDGVILSVQQFGVIRPDKIAEWLNKPAEEVEREIIESRLGFKDPQTGNIQVRHEYLSGNVREKLAYAEEHNENGEYNTNIDELRKVIPIDIPAHLIEFNIGSTWIPTELYQEYLKDKFDVTGIKLTHVGSAWVAGDLPWSGKNEKNRSEGVYSEKLGEQVYGSDLMIAAMNNVPLVVSRTEKHRDGTTETITDKEATAACSDKISQIKDDFVEWARGKMQQDSELAERVQKIYNDRFNAIVPMMKVDDIFLSKHLPGQNHKYELYKHQQNAVVRATTQPIMLAHEVGTGKTITLISTAMEMRRLGTAKKPMIVVQNATTPQFVKEAKDLYPNAKILTVSERDRTREGRQEFYAKIKYNDWDLIIVPQSVFDMIPDSESRMRDFINEKIEEKIHAIEAAKEAGLDQKITNRMEKELENLREDLETNNMSGKRGKKATEKDAKKAAEQRANAEARAQAMLDRKTDDVADFDDMGIDALLIDEAHNYKHLGFSTMMTRGVKGIDPSYSKRAAALYLKCQSVYERQGHRNVVFATGTPISNTAAEIWTFMKYLLPKEVLKENDIYYFDDFVHNFGKINEQLEFQTNGKFKPNNRFSQYGNVPELMRMWLSCADCVLTREVGQVNDKVPEIENGGAQDIFLPQSPSLIDIMATVRAELERYEQMSGKEKKENSHIPLTMYGIAKRAAIDPRLVDANAADEPLSKTNKAVEEVLRSLNDSKKYNGTAAIFCDSYQNKQSGFNLFQDIKDKLVKKGVPASKIAIIRSDMTDTAKQKIFDAVREGEIRVIMGSTQTLGTGVNIQTRLHTLIHMDAPDRPMDYTQRNGRIVRQGNMHKQWNIPVRILRFGVEDSLDVTSYQRLKTKAGFIDSIMNGKAMIDNNLENRVLEDVEEGIFDNPVAMLSGSQYALLKTQAERDLRKWSARKQQHNIDQILITDRLKKNGMIMQHRRNVIAQNEKFLQQLEQQFPNGKVDEYNIDGTICHNADELKAALKELNADIQARADKLRKEGYEGEKQSVSLTLTFNGVPFNVDILLTHRSSFKDGSRIISVDKEVHYSVQGGERIVSPTKVLDKLVEHIEQEHLSGKQARADIKYSQDYIARLEKENELMHQREGKPFAHEEELQKAQQLVDEYTEKMKEELAAKEAKYANLASGKKVELNEETDEEETDTPEAQYDELEYSSRELTEAERLAAQAEVESLLNNAGLDVRIATDEEAADAHRKTSASNIEAGGALVDQLERMGIEVSTDLEENRKALANAKRDKSDAGAIHYYKTQSGQQYGFSYKGKIYIDPRKVDANLALHEYGHLWCDAFRKLNPQGWKDVIETIKSDTDSWNFITQLRPELKTDDEIADEVIATFSGKRGEERLKAELERMSKRDSNYKSKWQNIFKNISKAIQDFWKAVGDFLNIQYKSAEQVYDQVLKDFADNMNPRKRVNDFLLKRNDAYMRAAESGDTQTATAIFNEALRENIGNGITPFISVGNYIQLKRLAKGVKTRDAATIKEAAELIAPLIPHNAVLVPAPSHTGRATDMLDLANAIADITGSEVKDILTSAPRTSQYQQKKETGMPTASKDLGITANGSVPNGKVAVVIDNVVDSGNTAEACVHALGKGIVVSLADSAPVYGHAASLKSAAPILNDKNGNIIPLDRRFDLNAGKYLGRIAQKDNEIERVINEEKPEFQIAYNGSGSRFDIFDPNYIGGQEGALGWGYGFYFGNYSEAKWYAERFGEKGERQITKVKLPSNKYLLNTSDRERGQNEYIEKQLQKLEEVVLRDEDVKERVDRESRKILERDHSDVIEHPEEYEDGTLEQLMDDCRGEVLGELYPDKDEIGRVYYDGLVDLAKKLYPSETRYDNYGHNPGAEEIVSKWLQAVGIKGTRYDGNRVVFDTADIEILYRREFLLTPNGKLYGWAVGNRISLTKDGFNPNTPVHEYSHLWIKAIKQNNRELYDNLMDLFSRKNLPQMYEELDKDPNYADLSEEGKMSEVFARFSGKRGAQRMTEEAQAMLDEAVESGSRKKVAQTATLIQRMKALLKKAWDWIGEHLFNIKNFGSREEAADRALYDMLNGTDLNLDNSDRQVEKQVAPTTPPQTRRQVFVKAMIDRANALNDELKAAVVRNADGKNAEEIRRLQKGYADYMQSALKEMQNDIKGRIEAQRLQKAYDKGTIDALSAYANMFIQSGWAEEATKTELARLIGTINNGATQTDIVPAVQKMLNLFTNTQLRQTEKIFDRLLKTPLHKLNISGVREQGKVDIRTQYQLNEIKTLLGQKGITYDKIEEHISDLQDKVEEYANDDTLREEYSARLDGAFIALQFFSADGVVDKQQEAETLKQELKDAQADKSLSRQEKQELIASIEQAMLENEQDQIIAYQQMNALVADILENGRGRAKSFLAEQKARQAEIHHYANSDLKGVSAQIHRTDTREQRLMNSPLVSGGLFSPLASLNSMLKRLAPNALNGRGYMYNHFIYGITEAAENEYLGLKQAFQELDDKVSEIWGKKMTFADAERELRNAPKIKVTVYDAGLDEDGKATRESREIQLTQAQVAYLYMVNKMTDGKMKLRKMGVTEEDIEKIKKHLDPKLIQLCDWLQNEYLTLKRNKYNAVHEQMFGAPMAAIENYFPLRIVQTKTNKKEDVADNNAGKGQTRGTMTGAIKQRVRNSLPLDIIHSDIFSVMIDHLQEMEHWAAYAQITRDTNQLLSYNTFKNKLNNMSTVYGAGKQLFTHLKDAFRLALGTYEAKQDPASAFTAQVAKGLSIGAISLRMSTAVKQLLSHPAYWTELTHPTFALEYGKNLIHPYGAVKWALDNLPLLHKRWNSRAAGDTRILDNEDEWRYWHNHVVEWCTRIGMSPNAFIDMVTCAQGAKAYYELKRKEYIEAGMTQEDAEKRARQDAEIFFNETQQSSEGAFIAPIQRDRSWSAIIASLFNNANFAYTRRTNEHLTQFISQIRNKNKVIEFNTKLYQRAYNMDEDTARAKAEKEYKHAQARNLIGIAIFGYIIQQVWRIGGNWLYMIIGDDDDEKKKMIEDASLGGGLATPVRGMLGGKSIEALLDVYQNGWQVKLQNNSPLEQDINKILEDLQYDRYAETVNDIVDVLVGSTTGIRPITISNIVIGIYDTVHALSDDNTKNDLETTREIAMLFGRAMSVPQSQLDKIYIDELGCTAQDIQRIMQGGDTNKVNALAQRYIEYHKLTQLPLTAGNTFDEEQDNKLNEKALNKFMTRLKDRYTLHHTQEED